MNSLRARPGIVLPAVIGVLVLIELLSVAILAVAYQELAVARERATAVQAQLASRSGAARVAAGQHREIQSLAPGGRRWLQDDAAPWAVQKAELERLSPSLFLLRSEAEWGSETSVSRAALGLLLIGFDPVAAFTQLPAALNLGGAVELSAAAVNGLASNQVPPGWSTQSCASWLTLPDVSSAIALPPGASLRVDSATRIDGSPTLEERAALADSAAFVRLGGTDLNRLAFRADRRESGTLELNPSAESGNCRTDAPSNWGAPLDPSHPCADYFPFIHAAGSLEVSAGAGQGTLLVDGDLSLLSGVRFFGLLLVRGRLYMGPGARLEGAALARAATLQGAAIHRSHCALVRALQGAAAWNQLRARSARAWIPVF